MQFFRIDAARKAKRLRADSGEMSPASPLASPRQAAETERRGDVFELAPEILTLCSGALQPFDFNLTPSQHEELFLAGQLFTHLYASRLGGTGPPVLSDEQKLKVLLCSCAGLDTGTSGRLTF